MSDSSESKLIKDPTLKMYKPIKPKVKTEVNNPVNNPPSMVYILMGNNVAPPSIVPDLKHKSGRKKDPPIKFEKVSTPKNMLSNFWKYFGYPADKEGEILSKQKLVCTLCLSQFPYTSSKNTSNIKRHLLLKHRAEYIELVQTKPNIKRNRHVGEEDMSDNGNRPRGKVKSTVDLITDCVIRDLQPPSIVNNEGFRQLVSHLDLFVEIPTEASIIQEFIPAMYDETKNTLYTDITVINATDNKFALSIEHWEANSREYISYYINYLHDEDTFKTKLLHTFLLDKDCVNDTFYHEEMFKIVCNSWNIKTANIRATVLASENLALHQALMNLELRVLPCLSHSLTQMCLNAFQKDPISAVLTKCRNIISRIYNKNSFAIEVRFEDTQNENNSTSTYLSLDNPHVWTSTFNMLESLNAARSKLNFLLDLNEEPEDDLVRCEQLTEEEWYIVSRIVEIFNPIKVTVETLSEEKASIASLILPLCQQLVHYHLKIETSDDSLSSELKTYFADYLTDKYSSADAFLQICTALDPRVKKLPYIEEEDVFGGAITDILVAIEPPSSESTKYYTNVVEQDDGKRSNRRSGMEFLLGNVTSAPTPVKTSLPSHADNIAHEISLYRHSSPASLNDCPLTWWKIECNRYPNLYPLALKYNCVPACVASKNMDMKSQCTYVERRKLLAVNSQAVLNHLLFLHHNSSYYT